MRSIVHDRANVTEVVKHESATEPSSRFLQRALIIIAVLSIPPVVASVSRVYVMGWHPIFAVHIGALVAIWAVIFLRLKLSVNLQAIVFLATLLTIGVSGLLQFGGTSMGEFTLGLACMLVTSKFGMRWGMLAIAACSIVSMAILIAVHRGLLVFGPDLAHYAMSPHAWVVGLVSFACIGGGAVVLAGAMRDELGSSLAKLQDRSLELERAIAAVNEEIQQRKHAEEDLRASEARFASVFNQAAVGIGLQSTEGVWLQANERICTIFGRSAEDMVGRSFADLTHPDDLEKSRAAIASMAEGDADRVVVEKRYVHRDGSVVWANSYVSIVRNRNGEPLFHVVVIEDVTERKRIEEEKAQFYRETISSVTDGKLQMIGSSESQAYEKDSAIRFSVESPEQIGPARQKIRDYCELRGLSGDPLELYIVGLGEAMGNAIKHAASGEVFAGSDGDLVWVGVADKGPGIATLALPSATLRRGHSTKLSMGFGYSIMLNVADQIMLSTGPNGTRVVLTKHVSERDSHLRLEDIQDTWDSI